MKPLFNEGDYVYFMEPGKTANTVYVVDKVEDLVADYAWTSAVTPGSISNFTQVTTLQPKQVTDPELQLYQIRVGIDVGTVYEELLAGSIRRTPYAQRRPTTTSPNVGYFDELTSPFLSPRIEFFLRFNENPSFAIYNKWGSSITPNLSFRGRKMRLYNLMGDPKQLQGLTGLDANDIPRIVTQVQQNKIPSRRVTVFGMEA